MIALYKGKSVPSDNAPELPTLFNPATPYTDALPVYQDITELNKPEEVFRHLWVLFIFFKFNFIVTSDIKKQITLNSLSAHRIYCQVMLT